ncbi:MAG: DUF2610 domain-containing protein [Anaplasmataceae bacterium]|nr:DUF2610 domain-containing protein [Anaplasmataceae bacterium]
MKNRPIKIKSFEISCKFGSVMSAFTFYVGEPKNDSNSPIQNQEKWLSSDRGGEVPGNVKTDLVKIHEMSKKYSVSFIDLFEYAITAAQMQQASRNA